jgi:CRISPR/Cas system CMR-associated protein Cmr1 (group 7 of RAMP superfamily)
MRTTTTEDQIATVLALRPRGTAPDRARSPLGVLRGKRSEHTTSNVVELSRRRRPAPPEPFEPQGGDAA